MMPEDPTHPAAWNCDIAEIALASFGGESSAQPGFTQFVVNLSRGAMDVQPRWRSRPNRFNRRRESSPRPCSWHQCVHGSPR